MSSVIWRTIIFEEIRLTAKHTAMSIAAEVVTEGAER